MVFTDGAALAMNADFARQRREHKKRQELRHDAHVHARLRYLVEQSKPAPRKRKAK